MEHTNRGGYVSDSLVRMTEEVGLEVAVTLLVAGTIVTGHLTPMRRYIDWHIEVTQRGIHAGGHTVLRGLMEPLTKKQGAEIAEQWRQHVEELGAEGSESISFQWFPLRNAEVRSGVPMNWPTFPYLLIAADHVSAITLGLPAGTTGV